MERFTRLLMLLITMMFGIIPINNVQAEDIPFDFHTPYQKDVKVIAGGAGSYYDEPDYHIGKSKYCIDFNSPDNSGYAITATSGGKVVEIGNQTLEGAKRSDYKTAYDYDVAIEHEGGYFSLYMHLRSNNVSLGDEVRAGQVIGQEGTVGATSTGSHLHFCIFNPDGQSVKPSPMDGTMLEDDGESLITGRNTGYTVTSKNREVTEDAFNAIRTKADELWARGLILHETENMHWYGGVDATERSFIIEDWNNGTWGWVALTFDPNNVDQQRAYVLRHSFWTTYRNNGGPNKFGAPLGDELDMTRAAEYAAYDPYCDSRDAGGNANSVIEASERTSCIERFCGSTKDYSSMQRFSKSPHGTLCWNTDYGYACEPGLTCPEDITRSLTVCATEIRDNLDNDCDGLIDEAFDLDGDGWSVDQGDCSEASNGINPYAVEIPDGLDNDCDGLIDEDDDNDHDGWYSWNGDCDDTADHVNPSQPELWDNVDNDCDGLIDEIFDLDGDGYSQDQGDCSEHTNSVYPGAVELNDDIDNNCDGVIDEGYPPPEDQYVFFDFDGNGDDDPCVRRDDTMLCLYDSFYGTWSVFGDVVGTGEYLITRSGRTHYYDYSGADGISDLTVSFGETWADEFLYWNTTIVARYGSQLQIDRNMDGIMDTYLYYGQAGDVYYLADLSGDHAADLIVRRGNTFYVDTNTDGVSDFWFTYGNTSLDSQWYFADFDGDGKDGILVIRGTELYVCDTIVRNSSNVATWTMSYGNGL